MAINTVVLISLVSCAMVNGYPSTSHHCSVEFQETFERAMTIKRTCADAMYNGCCQVARASNIYNYTAETGVYDITNLCHATTPFTQEVFPPMKARCDTDSSDGGWTVLVRRTPDVDKRELFNRTWEEYENGFGDLDGEFWYGLKNMHCLTTREPMEVEVEVNMTDGSILVLSYGNFRVDGSATGYRLHISEKRYTHSHDHFGYHNNQPFSTFDNGPKTSCSMHSTYALGNAGWWYNNCYKVAPTAMPQPMLGGSKEIACNYAEMRVRPKSCQDSWKIKPVCE